MMSLLHHWLAHPLALGLLGLLPMLGLVGFVALRRKRRRLARWGSRPALEALIAVRRRWRFLRGTGRLAGLVLLILGIAGPRWGHDPDLPTAPGRDLVVLLDMSRSMLAQDVLGQSAPNRLGRALDALRDLVDTVQKRGGHRLALVVFATRAQVICPLTHDYDHFRESLESLDPRNPSLDIGPGPQGSPSGTRIGAGLRLAVQTHDPRFRGHQDILMISDGDDPARDGEWQQGVATAREQGVVVHTVGVGDPEQGSPIPLAGEGQLLYQGRPVLTRLEEEPLKEIARLTSGSYTPARTRALPLGEIFRERIANRPGHEDTDDPLPMYRQRSPWFFAGALLLLTAETTLGDWRRRARRRAAPANDSPNPRVSP
jgi:Ca-activated chloride channel family protein